MFKLLSKPNVPVITRVLLVSVVVLGILHLIFVAIELYAPNHLLASYAKLFDLDSEYNVPTFYSGILVLTIAFTAWNLRHGARLLARKIFWVVLAFFFTYWAIDEVLVLHEQLAEPIRELLQIGYDSVFYHAWVLVALGLIGLVGIIAFVYHQFKMPPLTKKQGNLLIVLLIYMGGIVLFEIIGTKVYSNPELYRFGAVTIEELFEIGMGSYLLVKLLRYQE